MNDFLRLVPLHLTRHTPPRPTPPVVVEDPYEPAPEPEPPGFFRIALAQTVARWQEDLSRFQATGAAVAVRHVERVVFADQTMSYQPPPPPVHPPASAHPPAHSEPAEWWD